jgi:hypothetical protein
MKGEIKFPEMESARNKESLVNLMLFVAHDNDPSIDFTPGLKQ